MTWPVYCNKNVDCNNLCIQCSKFALVSNNFAVNALAHRWCRGNAPTHNSTTGFINTAGSVHWRADSQGSCPNRFTRNYCWFVREACQHYNHYNQGTSVIVPWKGVHKSDCIPIKLEVWYIHTHTISMYSILWHIHISSLLSKGKLWIAFELLER